MRSGHAAEAPLTALLKREMADSPRQAIPFRDYMQRCLYEPGIGYYNRPAVKIGKEGDFYTSASVGGVMGLALAAWIARLAGDGNEPLSLVEWGGGTGTLAAQTLDALQAGYADVYERLSFTAIEASPAHRSEMLAQLVRHAAKLRFADGGEWQRERDGIRTIVYANELLDAFPVHRVRRRGDKLCELHVGWDEADGSFAERELPCEDERLPRYLERHGIALADGQTADINLAAPAWIEAVLGRIACGHLVTIDYGDTADELYAPHRMNGTLLCYRRHLAHDDPYVAPGEQDMTAHVDFTACVAAGIDTGVEEWTLQTQRAFLESGGLLELLRDHDGRDPFSPAARRNRAIRQLLLSDRMSESFKVLIQTKRRE
ncbi:MAG: SAM-dependent methyltransferase [Paenibacillaceae bacterium]|nr:SAM-dependent methyltransferase [Paenibacillaceae bacterium]